MVACEELGDVRGLSMGLDATLGLMLAANLPAVALRAGAAAAQMRSDGRYATIQPFNRVVDAWFAEARKRLAAEEADREELLGRSMLAKAALDFAIQHIGELESRLKSLGDVPLTRREIEIAQLVAQGLTNRDMAERMHISERTVDSHVQSIIGKLNVRSRAQIASWYTARSATPAAASGSKTAQRFVTAILVLDIVDSTRKVTELGDKAWRTVLDDHYRLVSKELDRHGGVLIDTAGDGLLATFEAPAEAIRCAWDIQRSNQRRSLASRAGVHCGEVERAGSGIRGIAVHVATRLAALAKADEVIVSGTAVELAAGSGIRFVDRGRRRLKGIADRRQIFAAVEGAAR
jgi:class 3 adenylate cyclase